VRLFTNQRKHYCGIDLHANKMHLCILSQEGEILLHDGKWGFVAFFSQKNILFECISKGKRRNL